MKLFDRVFEPKDRMPEPTDHPQIEEERLMFEMEQIGKRIAGLRKTNNLTQQDLADQLGVTYQAVSNWERGLSMPDVVRLKDLAAFFNLSIDELLGNEKDARIVRVASGEDEADTIQELVDSAPYMKPRDLEEELLKKAGLTKAEEAPVNTATPPEVVSQKPSVPDSPSPLSNAPSGEDATQAPLQADPETSGTAEASDEPTLGLEDILAMAPFISSDTLSLLIRHLLADSNLANKDFLTQLAPFLDSEDLAQLVEMSLDSPGGFSVQTLLPLLPHLDSEALDGLVTKILETDSIGPELLLKMAPFLESDTLTRIIRSEGPDSRFPDEVLFGLAPFLEQEAIELLLARAKGSPELIRRLLPFTDTEIMDQFVRRWIGKK